MVQDCRDTSCKLANRLIQTPFPPLEPVSQPLSSCRPLSERGERQWLHRRHQLHFLLPRSASSFDWVLVKVEHYQLVYSLRFVRDYFELNQFHPRNSYASILSPDLLVL